MDTTIDDSIKQHLLVQQREAKLSTLTVEYIGQGMFRINTVIAHPQIPYHSMNRILLPELKKIVQAVDPRFVLAGVFPDPFSPDTQVLVNFELMG